MDEMSWRAELARRNINILDIHDHIMFVEFTYHPRNRYGEQTQSFKWCKTAFPFREGMRIEDVAQGVTDRVLSLRKELEG